MPPLFLLAFFGLTFIFLLALSVPTRPRTHSQTPRNTQSPYYGNSANMRSDRSFEMTTSYRATFADPASKTKNGRLNRQRSVPTSAGRRAQPQCKDTFKLEKLPTGAFITVPRQVCFRFPDSTAAACAVGLRAVARGCWVWVLLLQKTIAHRQGVFETSEGKHWRSERRKNLPISHFVCEPPAARTRKACVHIVHA